MTENASQACGLRESVDFWSKCWPPTRRGAWTPGTAGRRRDRWVPRNSALPHQL